MRILVRTSKWAVWARRLGALAVPLAIIPVLLHRTHVITSDNFIVVEAVALSIAGLAVLSAIVAFGRLWITGDQGWSRAAAGFIFGLLCVAPGAAYGWLAVSSDGAPDISTDFANPPLIVAPIEAHSIPQADQDRLAEAYPNARPRTYQIEAPQMFAIVAQLVNDQGWDTRIRRAPLSPVATGELNAVVTTFLGFQQIVAIRIRGEANGTTVDMRSTSLTPHPDFGENGQRVESFLLLLDNQVTQLLRNAPAQPAAVDD